MPGNLAARRAIDQHRVRQVLDTDVPDEALEVGRGVALLVLPAPVVVEIQAHIREQHPLRTQQAADAQIELGLIVQPRALRGNLIQQHPAHTARPDDTNR